jgi:hypothetical protein
MDVFVKNGDRGIWMDTDEIAIHRVWGNKIRRGRTPCLPWYRTTTAMV